MDSIVSKRTMALNFDSKQSVIVIGQGIVESLSECISPERRDTIAAICSDRVYSLHKQNIDQCLHGINAQFLGFDDEEKNKSYAYAESYFNWMLQKQCSRNSLLIGIGGGVTTDFAGYIASAYMRGIDVVYVPTTLLAMVDASIGGKVAVNIKAGKNIVGHFHQPDCIVIDLEFLKTLPESEWRCGLSEVVKHALIGDTASLKLLMERKITVGTINNALYECIDSSVAFKAGVVQKDEHEKNIRAILNFGHTIGHAVESVLGYTIGHGEAIAIGMLVELYMSLNCGLSKVEFDTACSLLLDYELLPKISFDSGTIINHMVYDKKNIKGKIRFVLLESIGQPLIGQEVNETLMYEALGYYLKMVQ